jgi:hypothetical protein
MPRGFFRLVLSGAMTASLPPAAMPDCQPPASAGPVSGSVNAASTTRQAAVRERDSYRKSPQRMAHFNPEQAARCHGIFT